MSNYRQIWETYLASWKTGSDTEKRKLFKESLSPDCVYSDPLVRTRDWEALLSYMADFHKQLPGGHFVTVSFNTHHESSIANWELQNETGVTIGDGVSFGKYNDNGKLVSMTAFFDLPTGQP